MELLRIAVCEDDQRDIDSLKSMITESGIPAKIYTYADGNGLLSMFVPGFFQLIFLDIYFDNGGGTAKTEENESQTGTAPAVHQKKLPVLPTCATGMDIAVKIRETDEDVWLAFITVSPDHAALGYKVDAKRYFSKPPDYDEVVALLQKAAEHFSGLSDEISLTIDRKRCRLRARDIRYVEAQNKKCMIHMGNEILAANITIDGLSKLLAAPGFVRCHRSYIVNMNYVQSVDRDFTMINGDKVYIGHLQQWQVRSDYRKHLLRLAKEV